MEWMQYTCQACKWHCDTPMETGEVETDLFSEQIQVLKPLVLSRSNTFYSHSNVDQASRRQHWKATSTVLVYVFDSYSKKHFCPIRKSWCGSLKSENVANGCFCLKRNPHGLRFITFFFLSFFCKRRFERRESKYDWSFNQGGEKKKQFITATYYSIEVFLMVWCWKCISCRCQYVDKIKKTRRAEGLLTFCFDKNILI